MTPTTRNRLLELFMSGAKKAASGAQPEQTGQFLPLARYEGGGIAPAVPGALTDLYNAMMSGMTADPSQFNSASPEQRAAYDRQGIENAMIVGGSAGVGSMPFARPANSLGAFGARPPRNGFEIDYFGTPVQIIENPSKQQLPGLIGKTKYKAVRRIQTEDGKTFIWDAADPALHDLVAESLGISKGTYRSDMLGIDD